MNRVASSMEQKNFIHYNRINENSRNKVQNQISSQRSITRLRDDPVAAAQSMRFQSKANRLDKYGTNIESTINSFAVTESNLAEATEIMQRIRELTVQGANSTYTKEDTKYMALEVNQLLEELVAVSNQKDANGLALFSGTRTNNNAFRTLSGYVEGSDIPLITNVEYTGNATSQIMEYSDGSTLETQLLGNNVFWAENQHIIGGQDVQNFVVQEDSAIVIDDQTIDLKAGDSVYAVIEKINQSPAAVQASLDPVLNTLVLKTTVPHQLWLDDAIDGNVLASLGIIEEGRIAPNNMAVNARVWGGSAFDVIIQTRDALINGDHESLGGKILGGIDQAFNNLNTARTELGSREARITKALSRIGSQSLTYKAWDDQLRGLNFADATTELSAVNTLLKATYSMASNIMSPTLMDFLR